MAYHRFTRFNVSGHIYVTPILLHGGIPDKCLPDFFKNVLYPIVSGALDANSESPESIVQEWRSRSSLYLTTDVPVRRFLEEGGKPAADFLARCIEMARVAYQREPVLTDEELGLPDRVVQHFEDWWRTFQPTLFEQSVTINRRPRIEFDERGGVRLTLPEQTIAGTTNAPFTFQVKAGQQRVGTPTIRAYARARGVLIESQECPLPPALKYSIKLEQRPHLSREWVFEGVRDSWIAFVESGAIISRGELPRARLWIGLRDDLKIEGNVEVIEEIRGADEWEQFRFCLIDASVVESLAVVSTDEEKAPLPLATNKPARLRGNVLMGCEANNFEVYTDTLPTIEVPLSRPEEISEWDVIVEDLSAKHPVKKRAALKQVATMDESGIGVVHLDNEMFLGKPLAGEFRVKLRARGALGRDKQIRFAYVRDLEFEFDRPLYLAGECPQLTLLTAAELNVTSQEEHIEIHSRDGICELRGDAVNRSLTLSFEATGRRSLPVTFSIPRVRWTVQGLNNHSAYGWLSNILEVQLEDFESSDDATLIVQLPFDSIAICSLELEGTSNRKDEKVRKGEARFSLGRFRDSLRQHSKPLARFSLSFSDTASDTRRIYPLLIRARWVVDGFESHNKRIVSFHWKDQGCLKNRKLRLWDLLKVWEPPKEYVVPDGESGIEISEPASVLPEGPYRVELLVEDEFETPLPPVVPQCNGQDVFDIKIGEGPLNYNLKPPPITLHSYLASRLAGCDENMDLRNYSVTKDGTKDLARTLIFLLREGRIRELKQIWEKDLRYHIKHPQMRYYMREEIDQLAERGDDNLKSELLNLSALIGIAVDSLIPFPLYSKVQIESKVALFKGIKLWGAAFSADTPSDLILLEYLNAAPETVPLTFLHKMRAIAEDVSLSSLDGRVRITRF